MRVDAPRIELFSRRLSQLGYLANAAPSRHDEYGRGLSTIQVGRGQNRIYILNVEQDECFLSALTDHASQVWYRAFRNPMKSDGFQKVCAQCIPRPAAARRVDDRRIEGSEVRRGQLGRAGLRISTCFETGHGDLLKQDITSEPTGTNSHFADFTYSRAPTQEQLDAIARAAKPAKDATGAASAPKLADRLRALNSTNLDAYRDLVDRLLAKDQSDEALAQSAFQAILHRDATADELAHTVKHLAAAKDSSARRVALQDIIWAIYNSRDFQTTPETKPARR